MKSLLTMMFFIAVTPCLSEERQVGNTEVNIRHIDGPIDHNHCTTRQFQHMTFCHKGTWFVFYSDGKKFQYQTSDDSGKTWHRAEEPVASAPNGSSSFDVLRVGGTVYISHARYPNVNQDVREGLCVLYSRSKDREHLGVPLAVMVSVGRF